MPLPDVFLLLAAALFGAVVWIAAAIADAQAVTRPLAACEGVAWWHAVWPALAGLLGIAFVAGWAHREPNPSDEDVALAGCALAVVVGAVFVRALVRALRALRQTGYSEIPIVTIGLLRCRILVSVSFVRLASPEVLAAAFAHEVAHVRGRDPLRIWLTQFLSDLQWPIPGARHRFQRWLLALEVSRDDQALAVGASPLALAEAILLATSLYPSAYASSRAGVSGGGEGFAYRMQRLMAYRDLARQPAPTALSWLPPGYYAALVVASVTGVLFGDRLLALLPGVVRWPT
jgi:Zn-dependent protease with chaperone function